MLVLFNYQTYVIIGTLSKIIQFIRTELKLSLFTPWKHEGGELHRFLTSSLEVGEWSGSRHGRFTTWKEPRYSLTRRLGGPLWRPVLLCRKVFLSPTGDRPTVPPSSISWPGHFPVHVNTLITSNTSQILF